jgi:hypothetical protein
MSVQRACDRCGASIDGRRPQAKFCSGSCRASASRQRAAERASTVKPLVNPATANGTAQKPHGGTMRPDAGTSETVGQEVNQVQALLEPLCPDARHCKHWLRFPTGPWSCEHNHPRAEAEGRAA